jgi:hypothetical protein
MFKTIVMMPSVSPLHNQQCLIYLEVEGGGGHSDVLELLSSLKSSAQ